METTLNANSYRLAREKVLEVTGSECDDWQFSADPVCGMGDEFFFTHKTDENRFVYVCVEDGIVTSVETN
jgi:hypothetical protein